MKKPTLVKPLPPLQVQSFSSPQITYPCKTLLANDSSGGNDGAASRGRPQGIALVGPRPPRCTRAFLRQQSLVSGGDEEWIGNPRVRPRSLDRCNTQPAQHHFEGNKYHHRDEDQAQ